MTFSYTIEELKKAILENLSIAGVCRDLNIKPAGGNYTTINRLIKEYNIDTSHFTGRAWNQGKHYKLINPPRALDEILTENSNYLSNKLKNRLIKEGLKPYMCESCKNTEWLNKPIKLELHHINGNHTDNRLENLLLLCPNCHAYTDNYRGKNITNTKKENFTKNYELISDIKPKLVKENKSYGNCIVCGKELIRPKSKYCCVECYRKDIKDLKRPSAEQLILDLKIFKTFTTIGAKYGVSDNAIRKWCKLYMLPTNCSELQEFLISHGITPKFYRNTNVV